jgi:hypothetical protein
VICRAYGARMNRGLLIPCVCALVACDGKTEVARLTPVSEPAHAAASKDETEPVPVPQSAEPSSRASAEQPRQAETQPAIDFSSPDSAMATFAYGMRTKNESLVLQSFAKGAAWYCVNTIERPWGRARLTYAGLAVGITRDGDYRGFLFGEDGDDSFRDFFTDPNQAPWKSVGKLRYAWPESDPERPTYVQWKKLGPRYVVSEIAYPAD